MPLKRSRDYIYDRSGSSIFLRGADFSRISTRAGGIDRRDMGGGTTNKVSKPIILGSVADLTTSILAKVLLDRRSPVIAGPIRPPSPPVTPRPVSADAGRSSNPITNGTIMPSTISDTILGLGGAYFNAKYAGQSQPQISSGMTIPSANVLSALGTTPVNTVDRLQALAGNENEMCGTGCNTPRYLTYDCRTGEFKKKRRRRRRVMLTMSDRDDLTFIAGLSSNANVKSALASRISRS